MAPKRSNRFIYILIPLIFAGLVYGVFELLALRLEQGDAYPPYSSLRTDPMGTKAFCDGLQEMRDLTVTRNYGPADRIVVPKETTLLDLGDYVDDVLYVPVAMAPDVESYIIQGGRMVITLVGENEQPAVRWKRKKAEPTETPTVTVTPSGSPTPSAAAPVTQAKASPTPTATEIPESTFGKQWGVDAGVEALAEKNEDFLGKVQTTYQPVTVALAAQGKLPKKLLWHSALYFKNLDPAWKVLYLRGDHPVAIERSFGKGSLVLLSDSYLVSNEAMQNDRHADLLAYLAGTRGRVIFDETHLGVFESDNTATLARKYGLGGFAVGLMVLALLFIWRNSLSLVPPREEESAERVGGRSGKDFSSGLVNLLKRNISSRDILSTAFGQWKKTFAQERKHLKGKVDEMEKELSDIRAGKSHPVEGYLRLSRIFKKRK